MDNIDSVVIKEDSQTIKKLSEELKKEENHYKKINKIGKKLIKFGKPTFVASILSPFDFEGPVIEIISAVVLITGLIMKKRSEQKLAELHQKELDLTLDDDVMNDLKSDVKNISDYFVNAKSNGKSKK